MLADRALIRHRISNGHVSAVRTSIFSHDLCLLQLSLLERLCGIHVMPRTLGRYAVVQYISFVEVSLKQVSAPENYRGRLMHTHSRTPPSPAPLPPTYATFPNPVRRQSQSLNSLSGILVNINTEPHHPRKPLQRIKCLALR